MEAKASSSLVLRREIDRSNGRFHSISNFFSHQFLRFDNKYNKLYQKMHFTKQKVHSRYDLRYSNFSDDVLVREYMKKILLLTLLLFFTGCCDRGVRVTLSDGKVITCKIFHRQYCGVYFAECSDNQEHVCTTNASVTVIGD